MTEACNIIAALDRAAQNWQEIKLLVNSAQGDKTLSINLINLIIRQDKKRPK
jgi:hypothetical protein